MEVDKTKETENIKDVDRNAEEMMSPEQLKSYRKTLMGMYREQTTFYEQQAKYEEALSRISVARRNRMVAEYEIAQLISEQKKAEKLYKATQENKKNSEDKSSSKTKPEKPTE